MKLAMTLLVRDEADIVETNIAFHLAQGVDAVVAIDNGSKDGTREILEDLSRHAPVYVFDEPEHTYDQSKWVTKAAIFARDELQADWILNNDADEFWLPRQGDIKDHLNATTASQIDCPRLNMVTPIETLGDKSWVSNLTYRISSPFPPVVLPDIYISPLPSLYFYLDLPPKALVRADGLTLVEQGNHSAKFQDEKVQIAGGIDIFHYPIRTRAQFERKIVQGGQSYAANQTLGERMGWHWRRWYRMFLESGLDAPLAEALPTQKKFQADIDSSVLVTDTRLQTALAQSCS